MLPLAGSETALLAPLWFSPATSLPAMAAVTYYASRIASISFVSADDVHHTRQIVGENV